MLKNQTDKSFLHQEDNNYNLPCKSIIPIRLTITQEKLKIPRLPLLRKSLIPPFHQEGTLLIHKEIEVKVLSMIAVRVTVKTAIMTVRLVVALKALAALAKLEMPVILNTKSVQSLATIE